VYRQTGTLRPLAATREGLDRSRPDSLDDESSSLIQMDESESALSIAEFPWWSLRFCRSAEPPFFFDDALTPDDRLSFLSWPRPPFCLSGKIAAANF